MTTQEEKAQRFKRVAARRTQKILVLLKLLGRCANKAAYAYSEEDVKKIFGAIEDSTGNAKQLFNMKEIDFKL